MSFEKIIDVPRLNRFKTKILNLVYKKDEVYNKNEIDNKFSQNAFSKVTVGSKTVAADSKADTLTLVAGSNVTLTPDATNDKITIAATDTKYSSKAAVSGGTDVSLVTTGEKATWNAKTSNTGTITQVKANGTSIATSGVANIPAASTSTYGVTKLTSDLTGNSESLAATQKAVNELNSNFVKKSVRYGAYEVNISLEQAILKHIDDMREYVPYFIHGVNIGGLSISATNDVMIEVTRYGETGKQYNNWYRVMIYDNQSSGIVTITNAKGSWNGWKTIVSAT